MNQLGQRIVKDEALTIQDLDSIDLGGTAGEVPKRPRHTQIERKGGYQKS